MSCFYYILLCGINGSGVIATCKNRLKEVARSLDVGIQFDDFYIEPYLIEPASKPGNLLCNISDSSSTTNCEDLIWPGVDANGALLPQQSGKVATTIVKECLRWTKSIALFIGLSGELYEELDHVESSLQDLAAMIDFEIRKANFFPALYITVRP